VQIRFFFDTLPQRHVIANFFCEVPRSGFRP